MVRRYIRRLKWGWAEHISRLRDDRWTWNTFWQPRVGKRKRGKQITRWKDDINQFLDTKNFQKIAANKKEWERLQETFALYEPGNKWALLWVLSKQM